MRAMSSVSYVITVYNKEVALPFVLAGLAAQEGEFAREFIFVDDESKDDSVGVVRRLTADWDNVTIIEQKNAGPSAAMNVAGFACAKGDWIKPMDSDDVLLPWATRRLMAACAETGFDVALAPYCLHYDFTTDEVGTFLDAHRPDPRPIERCADMLRRSAAIHPGQPVLLAGPRRAGAPGRRLRRAGLCPRLFDRAAHGGLWRLCPARGKSCSWRPPICPTGCRRTRPRCCTIST